jgi:hypothetical protein
MFPQKCRRYGTFQGPLSVYVVDCPSQGEFNFVSRRPDETRLGFERVNGPSQQFVDELAEGEGVESQRHFRQRDRSHIDSVSPQKGERIARH